MAQNHRLLAAHLGYDPERLYLPRQVHGAAGVDVVDQARAAVAETEVDFLVTAQPGVTVGVITADCVGVLLVDPAVPAVAAAHAGWRGLVAGVLAATVERLKALGARRERLRAALGPSIGPCCFEVGQEVAAAFEEVPGAVDRSRELPHVDLRRVALGQLESVGVPRGQVDMWDECTRCNRATFASYRAEGAECGTNLALVGLSP